MKTYLTAAGSSLLLDMIGNGHSLSFTKIQFGNGTNWHTESDELLKEEIRAASALQSPLQTVLFDNENGRVEVDPDSHLGLLQASFSNTAMESGWHVTEIGIFAQDNSLETPVEILYAVCAVDLSQAAWVPPANQSVASFDYEVYVYVGDVANVSAVVSAMSIYATDEALNDHIGKRNNPHEVTAAQVKLERVWNEYPHDLRPAFTEAEIFENIDGTEQSGSENPAEWYGKDRMSVLFGKIQKAIAEMISHFHNYNNPHDVTAAQVKAAAVQHYHDAGTDINKGILPTGRGGNGTNSGYAFTGTGYECHGYAYLMGEKVDNQENRNRLLIQWGRVNVDGQTQRVTFAKAYKDTSYSLTFPTCGNNLIPIWRNPTKETTGFEMNRTFGIDSTKLKKILKTVFTFDSNMQKLIDEKIGASQTADWFAVGQAAD